MARGGWNHKYGDILENILASFTQFYSGKNMVWQKIALGNDWRATEMKH